MASQRWRVKLIARIAQIRTLSDEDESNDPELRGVMSQAKAAYKAKKAATK